MKKIGLTRVIILILTACLGIRWIPVAGGIGPSAVCYWLLGAAIFLIPLTLIIMELSTNFSGDGGIHLWVEKALGSKAAYYVAWMYWINNLFFYPALIIFMVANISYLIGYKELVNNQFFVVSCVIVILWLAIFINIRGVKLISDITAFSCFLNVGLGVFIILAAIYYAINWGVDLTIFNWHNFLPNAAIDKNLSNLTLLMFALSGIELIPTLAGSVTNSKHILSRGLSISVIIMLVLYIGGGLSINLILTPHELNNTTGLMEALEAISLRLHLLWLAKILICVLLIVELGALIVWLLGPTIMFFECVEEGVLPCWLRSLNKQGVPANALYFIGASVTLIIVFTQFLPTVNSIFTTLVLMGTVVYFIPYLFLIVAYVKIKLGSGIKINLLSQKIGILCAVLVFLTTILGIIFSFVPNSDITSHGDKMVYELELIFGPLFFILLGFLVYICRKGRQFK